MKFLVKILITALVVYFLSKGAGTTYPGPGVQYGYRLCPGTRYPELHRKTLLIILTIPLTIITLGLFLLVINMIIVLLADKFVSGIRIENYTWAFIFSIILSIVTLVLNRLKRKWSLK